MRVLRGAILSLFRALFLALAPLLAALAAGPERHLDKPDAWFAGDEGRRIAAVILSFQSDLGGWPQSSPPGNGYPRHITFNDNTMVRLLEFVREVARDDRYAFVDGDRRGMVRAGAAVGVPDRHHQR
jgi:hypothetical protein